MKKFWHTLSAVAFCAALTLPVLPQAEAGTFTFTPSKPAETTTQQQPPAAQPQVKSLKLAVVPLMIGEKVEDNEGMKPIVYSNEIAKKFQYPEYDMVDSDIVRKVALQEQDNLFTQAGLEAVAKASGADVVIAMAVDKFDVKEDNFRREPVITLSYQGRFATVNMLNHKFKKDNWRYGKEMESEAINPRSDWPHHEFGLFVRRELNKVIKNNK